MKFMIYYGLDAMKKVAPLHLQFLLLYATFTTAMSADYNAPGGQWKKIQKLILYSGI